MNDFSFSKLFNYSRYLLVLALIILISSDLTGQIKNRGNHPALKSKDIMRSDFFAASRSDRNGKMNDYILSLQKVKDSIRQIIDNTREGKETNTGRNSYKFTQWYPLGPSQATDSVLAELGLVSALWVDTTDFMTIYAGSNTGGFFATYDGGQNWQCLSDSYMTTGVLAIEVDPDDKNHIYVGTGHWGFSRVYGQGVMESKDGGHTWSTTSLNSSLMSGGFIVQDIKIHHEHPDTLIAILNTEFNGETRIYRSPNKGKDWELIFQKNAEELFDIVKKPGMPNYFYAVGSLLLRTYDSGNSWQDITYRLHVPLNHKISRLSLTVTDSIPGLLLVFAESYDTLIPGVYKQTLFRSRDNGRNFEEIGIDHIPFAGYWKMELQFSVTQPNEFYLGGVYLFKYILSKDSARYTGPLAHNYHKDVRDLLIFKGTEGDKVYMGNDGGVTRSDNGALTWHDITRNGMQSTQFYNIAISDKGNMVYCGPQDGNLCFYNYDTRKWTRETHIGDAYDGLVDYNDPDNVYMVTFPPKPNRKNIFLLKSDDAGDSFEFKGVPDTTEVGRNNIPIVMDPTDPKILYAGLKNVWKSTDGAENWVQISNFNFPNQQKIQALEVAPTNTDVICAAFEGPTWGDLSQQKVMITVNGGTKWNDITPRGNYSLSYCSVTDIFIHPNNPLTIYLALDRNWKDRRMYVTHDGGRSWNNFSEGLPTLSVNAIRYYKGAGYDILFAATDVGVYYRDELMNKWEIFGAGLPLTIISDIEINYGKKKLVAGTFGRGLWEADICLPLDDEPYVISDTLEWPSGKNVLSDLILMPGSKVTMKSKIEIGDGRTIKILPGAQLILEEATLTNNCSDLWQGIKLYGHSDFNSNLPQGKITLRYGSVIENAYIAIETIDVDNAGNEIPQKGGGIIYANKAYFKNNLLAVDFKPTKGINPSSFILTEFSLKKPIWSDTLMHEHVRINCNRGISFVSCIFRNDISFNDLPVNDRGIGINSYNSSIKLYKISPDSVPFGLSTKPMFFQLKRGISATASTPGYSIYIDDITFKNNYTGAYIAGLSTIEVADCSFELKSLTSIDSAHQVISGMYIDNCSLFNVHDNIFKGTSILGINNAKAGLIINNCGEANNLIACNKYSDLSFSVLAQNKNRNIKGNTGLRFYYNHFIRNLYDIGVTTDSVRQINGIAYYQGVTGNIHAEAAGNQFSNLKSNIAGGIFNEGEPIIYSHNNNSVLALRQVPKYYCNTWLISGIYPVAGDSTYRPEYLIADTTDLDQKRFSWNTLTLEALNNYNKVKDGGSTEELINEIRSVSFETAPLLYNKLRSLDSKLSDEVIVELLKNNAFVNTFLIDILYNNPVIFRNRNLQQLILERNPDMPAFMLHQLIKRYKNYSLIELLESGTDNLRAIKDAMTISQLNELWFMNNSESDLRIQNILNKEENPLSDILSAFMYANEEDSVTASKMLHISAEKYPDNAADINQMIELFELNERINSEKVDTLTSDNILKLQALLKNDATFIYAENILQKYNVNEYIEPYIIPGKPPLGTIIDIPDIDISGSSFKIYPLPASDYIMLDYFYDDGFEQGDIEVINLTGQIVKHIPINSAIGQQIIDVRSLIPGMYIVRVRSEKQVLDYQKVMIIR